MINTELLLSVSLVSLTLARFLVKMSSKSKLYAMVQELLVLHAPNFSSLTELIQRMCSFAILEVSFIQKDCLA